MELRDEGMCFACGPNNPIGLKLRFAFQEDGKYLARFTPQREHQGYDGITHGGILSTLLDEAMANLVYALGHNALTAEIKVRFKRRAPIGEEMLLSGWIISENRRVLDCAAEARNSSGELIAEAVGRMVKV